MIEEADVLLAAGYRLGGLPPATRYPASASPSACPITGPAVGLGV
jgi:hypothetical protein